jgi:hypothetical protein
MFNYAGVTEMCTEEKVLCNIEYFEIIIFPVKH